LSEQPADGFRIVIPARYGSSRLPGKPLIEIAGKPLIRHVWERCGESAATTVCIATDDERIADACRDFGADVAMTRADHHSGSDRIAEVIAARGWDDADIIVNVQGDEPCMPPTLIDQVADDLAAQRDCAIATLAHPIDDARALFDPHVVKVVTDREGFALYFSRAPLPWHRDEFPRQRQSLPAGVTFLRHIGLYAYRAGTLTRFVTWPPAPLERAEALEQLRALYNGEPIHVAIAAESPGPGVDTADDIGRVAAYLGNAVG
jgi:3-deoxy-manno-octulosonate cytidylyltransferase (CMP-KDO synthetase)